MSRYRTTLPQLSSDLFLTDGGLETVLMFQEGLDLPQLAAFVLLAGASGRDTLRRYYARYTALAHEHGVGLILDSPTWRASASWGHELGYRAEALVEVNRRAIELLADVRTRSENDRPIVLAASLGPRADGYRPSEMMSVSEAEAYHSAQVRTFAETEADFVSALTFNYVEEAIGVASACAQADMPVALSFTVETDGRLPTGQPLSEAIEAVDEATNACPAYYMVNCAHPSHFHGALTDGTAWVERVRGVRANASKLSHAELDDSESLDAGDPVELGGDLAALRARLPHINVLGGCCGTDHRHIAEIGRACGRPLR